MAWDSTMVRDGKKEEQMAHIAYSRLPAGTQRMEPSTRLEVCMYGSM